MSWILGSGQRRWAFFFLPLAVSVSMSFWWESVTNNISMAWDGREGQEGSPVTLGSFCVSFGFKLLTPLGRKVSRVETWLNGSMGRVVGHGLLSVCLSQCTRGNLPPPLTGKLICEPVCPGPLVGALSQVPQGAYTHTENTNYMRSSVVLVWRGVGCSTGRGYFC